MFKRPVQKPQRRTRHVNYRAVAIDERLVSDAEISGRRNKRPLSGRGAKSGSSTRRNRGLTGRRQGCTREPWRYAKKLTGCETRADWQFSDPGRLVPDMGKCCTKLLRWPKRTQRRERSDACNWK
ncbi:hypothetical protein BAUCODRAFT_240081 [Baudoinia panamericana UAMH 10762]|uniref:Uncharacterized protein n=1 Tax=Baudoinia panamericana (strain UAMH 10762) TaxID=717646 RepID=M2MAC6_BAUPA|nr:uncharacterized protein BAUCODRAFT_240081 [Baudoinia panamericana UAMH 10762]EMC93426.1 hypothetical protein BAUCODRAFT_240081 [Baudoinia panamericana UAMH 10762]